MDHLITTPKTNPSHAFSQPWNPLSTDPIARRLSSYLGSVGGELKSVLDTDTNPKGLERCVHAQLTAKILDASFPCVAARSAFNRSDYRFGVYPQLASDDAVRAVCHDLYEFNNEFDAQDDRFTTFLAVFPGTDVSSEEAFEKLLWQQLQRMHELDIEHFEWSPAVSHDPESTEFSFSVGGRAHFVVGLNPKASRLARVAPWPVLVFNPHEQFERLRTRGKYEGMQRAIRARDIALQGNINPTLANFGERSETRQYSGRQVPEAWKCPFHHVAKETDQ
ncbi:guanitoxin biosynthesis heme-dependent pre-guanitoxin N-hydroxylase GntA [soil metagenome]